MTIASELPLPELLRSARTNAEWSIAVDTVGVSRVSAEWFREWRLPGGKLWLSIGRIPNGYLLRFRDYADFTICTNPNRIVVHPVDAHQETLRHLLIDQVLPLALSRRGHLVLHASAVHLPGVGAVGFVGATGRGKSTLAAALAHGGAQILTDDCLAIDFRGGAAYAVPGYPGLRLWPGAAAGPLLGVTANSRVAHYSRKRRLARGPLRFYGRRSRLRVLFLLSARAAAGAPVAVRRVRAPARLMGLLRFAYLLDVEDRKDLTAAFSALARVATGVPVLRLRLRHGHSRLPEAADRIRAYAAGMLTS
ncbi:MAG TPA: hypothetical protein VEL79_19405 [Vicinamibacterales bacterium]|nr:hypothetical protein [Vicinamibacterales bacterium]